MARGGSKGVVKVTTGGPGGTAADDKKQHKRAKQAANKAAASISISHQDGDGCSWCTWAVIALLIACWIGIYFIDSDGAGDDGSLYDTLGVDASASKGDIAKAYRRLAIKWCVSCLCFA